MSIRTTLKAEEMWQQLENVKRGPSPSHITPFPKITKNDECWYDHCLEISEDGARTGVKESMKQYCQVVDANGWVQVKCLLCRNAKNKPTDFDSDHADTPKHCDILKKRKACLLLLNECLTGKLDTLTPVPEHESFVLHKQWSPNLCQVEVKMRCLLCECGPDTFTDFDFSEEARLEHIATKKHKSRSWSPDNLEELRQECRNEDRLWYSSQQLKRMVHVLCDVWRKIESRGQPGKYFWYNTQTGDKQWSKPPGVTEP